jgi:phage-related protein
LRVYGYCKTCRYIRNSVYYIGGSLAEYEVVFYETADGECPAEDFLAELSPRVRGKVAKWLELLEQEGPDLPRPYADMIRGKIRELRVSFAGSHHRLLYYFHGKRIIVTHGFVKKTAVVPEGEIARAERCMVDFHQRLGQGGIDL